MLRSTPNGDMLCQTCSIDVLERIAKTQYSTKSVCHSGLVQIAFPIVIDGELIATILCGQVRLLNNDTEEFVLERIREIERDLSYSNEELLSCWYQLPVISEESINVTISRTERIVKYITQLGSEKLELQKIIRENEKKLSERKLLEKHKMSKRKNIPNYKIFMCHSKEDKDRVRDVYYDLLNAGLSPWLDEIDILPGEDWDLEIRLAIKRAEIFLAFLSKNSIDKKGYVQKEILMGLDMLDRMPEGRIYLIPVRLEDCAVPERLSKCQWVDLFSADGFDRLLNSFRTGKVVQ